VLYLSLCKASKHYVELKKQPMKLALRFLTLLILATVLSCRQSEEEAGTTAYEASGESVDTDNTEVTNNTEVTKQIPVTERKI
jgi:hypothetical protein